MTTERRRLTPHAAALLSLVLSVAARSAHAQAGEAPLDGFERPSARAVRTPTPPDVDGHLDDEVWELAEPIGELVQIEPVEGAAPSQRSDIRFLYDDDHLYIGLRFFDTRPDLIYSTSKERDARLDESDYVEMVLDTFLDRRNSFFFQINPTGSKGDALISNNGSDFNKPWDGIWEGEASIDEEGWSAELALPFKTLNFSPETDTWGFNVQRFIGRNREVARWSGAVREFRVFQAVHAGDITGIEGIHQGVGLDVVPFAVADYREDFEADANDTDADAGVDAFYKITPSMNLSLTYNTDFAEAEVDERKINLTRFPLFFPERRDFFLQDAGQFQFLASGRDVIPFFSRTIGLSGAGEVVPITAGAKVSGRAGDYDIGILDVLTDDFRTFDDQEIDGQNLSVARVLRRIGGESSVGAIVTNGDPTGATSDTTYGVEGNYRNSRFDGSRNLNASAWYVKNDSSAHASDDAAYGAWVSSSDDVHGAYFNYKEVQENVRPALGFVPRRGIRQYRGGVSYEPRVDETIRSLEFRLDVDVVTNLQDEVETIETEVRPFGIDFESGTSFHIEIEGTRENLDSVFTLNGVDIPAGSYDFVRYRAEFDTPSKEELRASVGITAGEFFDGDRVDYGITIDWNPNSLFDGGLTLSRNDVDLPGGDFSTDLARLRADFSFTPDLSWSNFAQWDNVSDTIGLNSRLRWIPSPGNDVFVVFNEELDQRGSGVAPANVGVSVKAGYTLRF